MRDEVKAIGYERRAVSPGILHFGVGNFHRAHQAFYLNEYLCLTGDLQWGICGAMILERDEAVYRALKAQDGVYGISVFGNDGEVMRRKIGSIVDLFWGGEDADAVISRIADPNIKIITLTITEGGYNLNPKNGEFDLSATDILHDLQGQDVPRTVFGYIAAGLQRRRKINDLPLTILSCDNVPHNGDACRKAFSAYFRAVDADLADWVADRVSFPNSMVDRITPSVSARERERIAFDIAGQKDRAPVYCEEFIQWVIEDSFAAGRPALERVGVEFVDDVSRYEFLKLGIVNSTHQMLSFPGLLAGYRKVDEAVADPLFHDYLTTYMIRDVLPYLAPPEGVDMSAYSATFMRRLQNKAISDQLARLCFDAANKIPRFMTPTVTQLLQAKADTSRVAFLIAAYRSYLRGSRDDRGMPYEIDDPGLSEADRKRVADDDPLAFLALNCFAGMPFDSSDSFVNNYLQSCVGIASAGIRKTLREIRGCYYAN